MTPHFSQTRIQNTKTAAFPFKSKREGQSYSFQLKNQPPQKNGREQPASVFLNDPFRPMRLFPISI
jgi:hypothetical protein